MDGNGAQFVKMLWIGLDLEKAIGLKRYNRYQTFIKHDINKTAGLCSTHFFRADSTLTRMTIQVTQLRLNSNPQFANLTQL